MSFVLEWGWALAQGLPFQVWSLQVAILQLVLLVARVVDTKVVEGRRLAREETVPDKKQAFNFYAFKNMHSGEETCHLNCLRVRVGFGPGASLRSLVLAGGHIAIGAAGGKACGPKGWGIGKPRKKTTQTTDDAWHSSQEQKGQNVNITPLGWG